MMASKLATFFIALILVLSGLGLLLHPGTGLAWSLYFDAWLVKIIQFSIWQALLSAVFSILLAAPFAIIFAQQSFKGEWLIKGLLNLFFIMPVLTIVLGVVAAFADMINVFSLTGIIIAHVFLNMPFALRLFWQRLSLISPAQLQIAKSLNFSTRHRLRWLYLPVMLQVIRPVFVLIFLLCFSSFTVVLTLGGGPANTNLEVAIYQALKFDFDPRAAAIYALIHGSIAVVCIWVLGKRTSFGFEMSLQQTTTARHASWIQRGAILLLLALLMLPIAALTLRAFGQDWVWPARLSSGLMTSLQIGVGSALVALCLAMCRALNTRQTRFARVLDFGLMVSPLMVVTTGLFLLALKLNIAFQITAGLIILLNGLMAMPLILSPLQSRINASRRRYSRLADSLAMTPWTAWRLVLWPSITPILPWLFCLALVLSIGDLGVAALIGSAQFVTLPILIYQAMGSYQMVLASQLTLLMLGLCGGLLIIAELLSMRRHSHA